MELVQKEPPKKIESATQETITNIVDKIGSLARKGVLLWNYENEDDLDPLEFNGYSYYSVLRFTLPKERETPGETFAAVAFLKEEGTTHEIVRYEVSRENGKLRMDKNEDVETEEDRVRRKQRKKELAMLGQKGIDANLSLGQEFHEKSQLIEDRRKSGESLVGEEEALEVLGLLRLIEEKKYPRE